MRNRWKPIRRVRYWRRCWYIRRGHPMAVWSPICISETGPARLVDGVVVNGIERTVRAYRCAIHDQRKRRYEA